MYRFCLLDGLNGPKTSTATLSKAPSTNSGKSGALLVFLGDVFTAQSTHDLHQCSTFNLKHARPPILLFQLLKSFVPSTMGTGDMIMYIGQNFVLHRLRNQELRKTIARQHYTSGYDRDDTTNHLYWCKNNRSLTKFFWLSHRCWANCHAGYNLLFHLTLDFCAVFHRFHQSQDHTAVRRSSWCLDMGALIKHQRYHFGNLDGEWFRNCIAEATKPILLVDQ